MTGDDASNLGQKLEELLRDGYRDFLLAIQIGGWIWYFVALQTALSW